MTKKGEKKAKAANTNKGPRQPTLPAEGMARKRIPALDKPADAYQKVKDKWQALGREVTAKKQELIAAARDALALEPGDGVKTYRYEGHDGETFDVEYSRKTKENVKVTQVAKAGADEDNE